jgi:hypothetical protein
LVLGQDVVAALVAAIDEVAVLQVENTGGDIADVALNVVVDVLAPVDEVMPAGTALVEFLVEVGAVEVVDHGMGHV